MPDINEKFEFRSIRKEEADEAAEIEEVCFPPNEACSREMMYERIQTAPEMLIVAIDKACGKMAGFLSGLSTDEGKFRDEFFSDASLYDPKGKNVMLLGLDVLPMYRRQGLARALVERYQQRAKEQKKSTLFLTCLDEKVAMYEKMGFTDMGESASVWGGEKWHDMKCIL